MKIAPLHPEIEEYLDERALREKFEKQKRIFEENPRHPSLHTELLEPRKWRIYSFRIDQKYRAIFHIRKDGTIEIMEINDHYQ